MNRKVLTLALMLLSCVCAFGQKSQIDLSTQIKNTGFLWNGLAFDGFGVGDATHAGSGIENIGIPGTNTSCTIIRDVVDQTSGEIWRESVCSTSFNGTIDDVWIAGWNCATNGGVISTSFGAICEQWESSYNPGANSTMEHHIITYAQGTGTQLRDWTSQYNESTGIDVFTDIDADNGVAFQCLTTGCGTGHTSAPYMTIDPIAGLKVGDSTGSTALGGLFGGTVIANQGSNVGGGVIVNASSGGTAYRLVGDPVPANCTSQSYIVIYVNSNGIFYCPTSYTGAPVIEGTLAVKFIGQNSTNSGFNADTHSGDYPAVIYRTSTAASGGIEFSSSWNSDTNHAGVLIGNAAAGSNENYSYIVGYNQGSPSPSMTRTLWGGLSGVDAEFYGGGSESAHIDTSGNFTMNTLGSSSTNLCITAGDVIATCSSLRKYKDKIQSLDGGKSLATVMALQPRTYLRKDTGKQEIGFIAEEMEATEPRLATYGHDAPQGAVVDAKTGRVLKPAQNQEVVLTGVNYGQVTALLAAAMQEQQKEIDALKAEIAELKAK